MWTESLARKAVDKWERSSAFTPGAVASTVRLRLSDQDFPEEWRLGNLHAREELMVAVSALEEKGLAIVRKSGRGYLATATAVVLKPEAIEEAYGVVRGPTRRAHGRLLQQYLLAEEGESGALWAIDFLNRVRQELAQGSFRSLGRGSHEPGTAEEIRDSLRALLRLSRNEPYEDRTLSGELLGDTKRLREIRPRLRQILLSADPIWADEPLPTDRTLFAHYGEIFKPPFTAIATTIPVEGIVDLSSFRPYAMLPSKVLMQLAEAAATGQAATLTTVENESAFLRYIEEPDVRRNIEARDEIVLYTEGYPTDDVVRFVSLLKAAGFTVRHWGDSDVYGVEIALLVGATELFRTSAEWLRTIPRKLSKSLDARQRPRIQTLIESSGIGSCNGAQELLEEVLRRGGWVEQEVFYAGSNSRP